MIEFKALFFAFGIFTIAFPLVNANQLHHNPTLLNDRMILKVASSTHDRSVIYDNLRQAYTVMFPLDSHDHSQQQFLEKLIHNINIEKSEDARENDERLCIENTNIKYFLKSLSLIEKEFEGSECRINFSHKFKSILSPTYNIHRLIHEESSDRIQKELELNLVEMLKKIPKLSGFTLNDFDNLNYDLQCLIGYQDLCQVKLKESVIEANVEKVVSIPPSCGFNKFDEAFSGQFSEYLVLNTPINGTFYCRPGRSATCKATIAESDNSHYKLFDD